jgi:DNA-binding response OmpR family regulator
MILIVDDDDTVRDMLRRVLMGEGYGVATAADGEEALQIAESTKIDMVLLDLNLPGASGWDIFERLTRSDPSMATIVITAKSSQWVMAQGAGVGALLEKPLDFPTLLSTVAALLSETPESRLERMTGHSECRYSSPTKPKSRSI